MSPAPRPGLQLFSVRREMDSDPRSTLAMVADLGIGGVELAGTHGVAPDDFAKMMTAVGLVPIGAMVGLEHDGLPGATLDWARRLELPRLVVNGWVDDFASLAAVTRFAERFDAAAETAHQHGIALLYHNHYWEFAETGDGWVPLHEFVARSQRCALELDIYWVAAACSDWRRAIAPVADAVRVVHVKDGSGALPAAGWAAEASSPVGDGSVDVVGMLEVLPAVEWHVIEFDAFDGEPFEQIARSRDFLVASGTTSP